MYIQTHKEFLNKEEGDQIWNYLQGPIFSGTQTSNGTGKTFFRADLHDNSLFLNLIPKMLPLFPEKNLIFQRCWAIAHQGLSHGSMHKDCGDLKESYYSAVLYPHHDWHVDWGGETVFFDPEKYEIIKSILPIPFGIAIFDSSILHCARPTTTYFMGIRYVINYMFKVDNNF